ncbi:bacterial Ig-like domain-containing protein [Enterococcus faecalis]|uniref:bacterial Ig-like domain-containing protein n=1 Tax=Enterococcus faecalis TaxID=1351 RepID=UPI000C308778|nr:bacterial Ig-like domain-containing protein [Enterococcus faecalis]
MKKILCSLLMLSLLLNHGIVAFAETVNSTSDITSEQQSESNDLDEKKQYSNADVSTDLNKSKDNTNVSDSTSEQQSESNDLDEKKQYSNADVSTDLNKSKDNTDVSDSKKIQEVDKNHNDKSIISYEEGDNAKDVPIDYRNNQPDSSIKWNVDKRFPNSGPYLKKALSQGIYDDLNSQISNYKLPANIGESVQIPLFLNVENSNYYYFFQMYDKSKLLHRTFWSGTNNNFQKIQLLKFKMDINQLSLKTHTNENASDFELTLDKKYVYSERDKDWNTDKEKTTLTIRRVKKEQNTEKININFDNVYFYGEGYFHGPWGFWDGTYAYRLFEPGQWEEESYGVEYNQEEFRSSTPLYYYRTKPEGDINPFFITLEEDKTKAELKDTELYVGQKWDLGSVFKNVVDKDGNPIKPKNVEWVWVDGKEKVREIDTRKAGAHKVRIALLNANNQWIYSNEVTVTVKEDKTKAELKDTELYVGQKWDLGSVFKNVVDKDGNPIKPKNVEWVWVDGKEKVREIDTRKAGAHKVRIALLNANNQRIYSNEVTVTVKEDKTKAELKDTELYVGQKWDLGSVFKNVVDKDGNPIKPEEVEKVFIDSKETRIIDTDKPGQYFVQIGVLNASNMWIYSRKCVVEVKEEPFTIKQIPYFDFEDYILVSTNKSVVNKKENPTIDLETPSIEGKDWQLQVELSPFLDKKNSKSILKGVSLFIPKGKLESDLETEEPTQYDCQLEANGKASILMHGTKTKGKGRWKNKLATKGITLSIPPENKTGNYESTLHWTLLDVPG